MPPRARRGVISVAIVTAFIGWPGTPPVQAAEVRCAGLKSTIVGTPGSDRLIGTSGHDVIVGLGGDDVIEGLGGSDTICAGQGADLVTGGGGSDYLSGGGGRDVVRGGLYPDSLVLDPGNDVIHGGASKDWLETRSILGRLMPIKLLSVDLKVGTAIGFGHDIIHSVENADLRCCESMVVRGTDRHNFLHIRSGSAVIRGAGGDDLISGTDGDDHMHGGNGNDQLSGRAGDDFLDGGAGRDFLAGGPGNDTCVRGELVSRC